MIKNTSWLCAVITTLLLTNCAKYEEVEVRGLQKNVGYVAEEFITPSGLKEFGLTSPIAIVNPGKVLLVGRFLLIGEDKKGIHVFDNITPQNPKAIAFITVPAITDFLLKGTTLIASNGDDLVALNISAINEIVLRGALPESIATNQTLFSETTRLEKVFTYPNYPAERGTYFECADSLIYVTKWKLDSNFVNPTCYR